MNVAIRADASSRIGLGHLARCLTLAKTLTKRGATVHFVCRAHPGNQIGMLEVEGYSVSRLPPPSEQPVFDGDYTAWLGVSQDQDADETSESLDRLITSGNASQWDWIIVDHYGLDDTWERQLRSVSERILVIDDLANRPHDCDVLLDQNFSNSPSERYAQLLPKQANMLLGPDFALLKPQYVKFRQTLKRCLVGNGDSHLRVRRVFIFFGGSDLENLTGRCLEALSVPELSRVAVDVVVGVNNPHKDVLARQGKCRGLVYLHEPRSHLADLIAGADLAVGAGGTTMWERCCLGLPSVVISIADNQKPACRSLAGANIIEYLGHYTEVKTQAIALAILGLINAPNRWTELAQRSASLVDGLGVQRVVDVIFQNQNVVNKS